MSFVDNLFFKRCKYFYFRVTHILLHKKMYKTIYLSWVFRDDAGLKRNLHRFNLFFYSVLIQNIFDLFDCFLGT